MTQRPVAIVALAASAAMLGSADPARAQTAAGISELTSGIRTGASVPYGQIGVNWSWTVPAGKYLALVRIAYSLHSYEHAASLRCSLHRPNDGHFDVALASVTGAPPAGIGASGEMTLMSQVTLATTTTLIVKCDAPFGGPTGTQAVDHLRLELVQAASFGTLPIAPSPTAPPAFQR
jgi:hypothetical protein